MRDMKKNNSKDQVIPKWFDGMVYKNGDLVTNPFSGEEIELNNIELSLYDFIIGIQFMLETIPDKVPDKLYKNFLNGLDWFRKNNIKAYMVLLD